MKIFDMFKKTEDSQAVAQAKAYYAQLTSPEYQKYFRIEYAGDGMSLAEEVICQYWKPRYLMDNNTKCAYEFLNVNEKFGTITTDDIDWDSQKGLPEEAIQRTRDLNAHYPTRVRNFKNGVAQVSWQLNPDGMYFMDEDGFGVTDDDEVEIYGFIDCQGKILVKFQHINEDWKRLEIMKKKAKTKVGKYHYHRTSGK